MYGGFSNFEFPHSSTYDSDLRELIVLVKKYLDEFETVVSTVDSLTDDVQHIEAEVEVLAKAVEDLYNFVDAKIAEAIEKYREEIDLELIEIRQDITLAFNMINEVLEAAKEYADAKDTVVEAKCKAYTDDAITAVIEMIVEINKRIDKLGIECINPSTGFKESVAIGFEQYDRHVRSHALTNYEYDDLGLSNSEYISLGITAWQYMFEGVKWIINPVIHQLHPVTGMLTSDYNIHNWLAGMIFNTQSDNDYAARDLTNSEYANLNLTNEEYFFTTAETQWG